MRIPTSLPWVLLAVLCMSGVVAVMVYFLGGDQVRAPRIAPVSLPSKPFQPVPDSLPPVDDDLAVPRLPIDGANGYSLARVDKGLIVREIDSEYQIPEIRLRSLFDWRTLSFHDPAWNCQTAASFVTANDILCKLWPQVLEAPRFEAPEDWRAASYDDQVTSSATALQSFYVVSMHRTGIHLYCESPPNVKEAAKEIVQQIYLGNRVERSRGILAVYFTGIDIHLKGLQNLLLLLDRFEVESSACLWIVGKLRQLQISGQGIEWSYKRDYGLLCRILDGMNAGEFPDELRDYKSLGESLLLNRTKHILARRVRSLISALNGPRFSRRLWELDDSVDLPFDAFEGNELGLRFYTDTTSDWTEVLDRFDLVRFFQSAVQVVTAVVRYGNDFGNLPTSLEILIPDYLDEIPGDPFGRSVLKWRMKEGFGTIYSIGKDGVDAGGLPSESVKSTSMGFENVSEVFWAEPTIIVRWPPKQEGE